jgi:hypothetical protein
LYHRAFAPLCLCAILYTLHSELPHTKVSTMNEV